MPESGALFRQWVLLPVVRDGAQAQVSNRSLNLLGDRGLDWVSRRLVGVVVGVR